MAGHVARMQAGEMYWKILVEKVEGRRPLERHRPRWNDNIKVDRVIKHAVGLSIDCPPWRQLFLQLNYGY